MMSYGLLFVSAFLAATILPFYSEVVLVSLLLEGKPALALWFYATLGNTLGAWVNWVMGRYLLQNDLTWGNAGNLSARISPDILLVTASGTRLGDLADDDFVECPVAASRLR